MQKYRFMCPHCGEETQIVERATIERYAVLIGFSDEGPEFSENEEFGGAEKLEYIYPNCSNELDVHYEQLCDYVKENGTILKENEHG